MMKSSKDIQLSELKDMIAQLNLTIETLNDTIAGQLSLFDNPDEEKPVEQIEPEIVETPRKFRRKNQHLRKSSRISQPDSFWQIPYPLKIRSVLFAAVKCWQSEQR